MKTICCTVLIVLVLFACMACSYPEAERYHNFILDLDIVTRFDLCIDQVERGKTSSYTVRELQVVQQDIAQWDGSEIEITNVNQNLLACAEQLLESLQARAEDQPDASAMRLESALQYYKEAKDYIRKNSARHTHA